MKLEHANLSVLNMDAMEGFLVAAFPDFKHRGGGLDGQGRPWRHIGNDEFYVALQGVPTNRQRTPYGNDTGLNHLGWEVDDLPELTQRMKAAGFEPNLVMDEHPARNRRYFHDPDGNDWEFVQYLTEDIVERNDYSR